MKKIKVDLQERSYRIFIGSGAVGELPNFMKTRKSSAPVVVITDKTVAKKTKRIMDSVIKKLPNECFRIIVPPNETSKTMEFFQDTVQKISKKTKTHRPIIVALGGGVVGDLAGFISATYRRGVPFVQIPTTLLAQVDSSIGGKTGIDLSEAKNLVGAFYQPKIILSDLRFLKTLPRRELRNGIAEVIKYAVITDIGLFDYLEKNMENILSGEEKALEKIVYECAKIKAGIVEKDELDAKDIRIVLNFGHTLGHAIEAAAGYSKLLSHGEAVAIGMILAGEVALRLDMMKETELERLKKLIKRAGFFIKLGDVPITAIMNSYGYDKKFVAGANRFVLPKRIGKTEIVDDIPTLLIRTVLRQYLKKN